ncbi:hypothetical protein BASA81_005634 [Batrachochytrium salamandrivorans]|nr:hypothetical protein BASA81_005634 [Batrachochytrium salamandrivorans]
MHTATTSAAEAASNHSDEEEEEKSSSDESAERSISSFQASHASSMGVFLEFLHPVLDANGDLERVDASQIVSKACFDRWLLARKIVPTKPEKSFQRTLSAHLTGLDGRSPFEPMQEAAILEVLRKPQRWPCFEHESVKFGAKGYHEKKRAEIKFSHAKQQQQLQLLRQHSSPPPPPPPPPSHTLLRSSSLGNLLPTSLPRTASYGAMPPLFPPVNGGGSLVAANGNSTMYQPFFPLDSPRFNMFTSFPPQSHPQQPPPPYSQSFVDPRRFILPLQQQQQPPPQPKSHAIPPPALITPLFPRVTQVATSTITSNAPALGPFSPTTASMIETQKRLRGCSVSDSPSSSSDPESQFLTSAKELLATSPGGGEAWQEVENLGRIYLLSKGWGQAPTSSGAECVLSALEQSNPCCLALALDLMERDSRKRVLAQTLASKAFLGPITRSEHGLVDGCLFQDPESAWRAFTAVVDSLRNPEMETRGVEVELRHGAFQGKFVLFVRAVSTERVVVVRAVPVT